MIELAIKRFPDGRVGTVIPLTFGRARITIGRPAPHEDLPMGYEDVW